MYANSCQRRVIERAKSIKVFCIDFGGTITTHQMIFKEDAHFGDKGCAVRTFGGSYFDGSNQVFLSVRAQCPDGQLQTGKITGFARFSSMKLSADAVYDIVSVPCRMTKPSKFS